MVSVLLPTMVPLHEILCQSYSDINRNLIASSELWKLISFLWINVTVMFSMLLCYYVLLYMFFRLCFVRFMGHVGLCSTKCSWDVLPDALCLAYYDCPLCVCTVSVISSFHYYYYYYFYYYYYYYYYYYCYYR